MRTINVIIIIIIIMQDLKAFKHLRRNYYLVPSTTKFIVANTDTCS